MKRLTPLLLFVLLIFTSIATPSVASEAEPGRGDERFDDDSRAPGKKGSSPGIVGPDGLVVAGRGFRPPPPRIVNRVLDLLDDETEMSSEEGNDAWESEIFDTSQYNRIGLRFTSDVDGGSITCHVGWRFSREDEFRAGFPQLVYVDVVVPLGDPEGVANRVPDGVPDLYRRRQYYPLFGPQMDYAEVRGLQARVRCVLGSLRGDYGRLGNDPDLVDPDPTDPIPVTGSLSDVKVLLRRE